jgi:hypothetical protein
MDRMTGNTATAVLDAAHNSQLDSIPKSALQKARIIGRKLIFHGREMTEFFWMAPSSALTCERCDRIYSPKDRILNETCGRELYRNDPEREGCPGKLVPNYYFLESPTGRLDIYSQAVGWMNAGMDENDARKHAWKEIFTYEGAQRRRPKILDEIA